MKKKLTQLLLILSMFGIVQCTNDNSKTSQSTEDKDQATTVAPEFNSDSAYHYINKQVSFGPRVSGSKANAECAEFLISTLKSFGAEIIVQEAKAKTFNGIVIPMKNIIASWQPENKKRVMLCSHWDSRPFADWDPDPAKHKTPIDGANDGASGVGVLLEIARHLSKTQPNIGIDIIFFDAEDYGEPQDTHSKEREDNWGLGSQYWSKNPHKSGYVARYGILLDMVGVKDATFLQEGYSMMYASHVISKVWKKAEELGYGKYFISQQGNHITDDHYYINTILGLPTIDIIHLEKNSKTGFFPYWHTVNDNMDNISKESLKAVGQTLMAVIYSEK